MFLVSEMIASLRPLVVAGVLIVSACASGQVTELGGDPASSGPVAGDDITAEEIGATYAKNAYGTVLNCVITGGTAVFTEGWHDYNPKEFRIVRGERKTVKLSHISTEGLNTRLQASFDRTGQKLSFCEILRPSKFGSFMSFGESFDIDIIDSIKLGSLKTGKCISVYALPMDFEPGIRRTLDVPNTVRGATLMCSYGAANAAGPQQGGKAYEDAKKH